MKALLSFLMLTLLTLTAHAAGLPGGYTKSLRDKVAKGEKVSGDKVTLHLTQKQVVVHPGLTQVSVPYTAKTKSGVLKVGMVNGDSKGGAALTNLRLDPLMVPMTTP